MLREASFAAEDGAASRAGDRPQRKRAQDQTEVRASSSPISRSNKHRRKGPDSDAEFLAVAERDRLLPGPCPRQDSPGDNRASNGRGYNNAGQQSSLRGGLRHNEASVLALLRPQAADDGGGRQGRPLSNAGQHVSIGGGVWRDETSVSGLRRPQAPHDGGGSRGRPLSREDQDNRQEMMDTDGEVDNRSESDKHHARPRARQSGPSGLSGVTEPQGPRSNSDDGIPEEPASNCPRDNRRRGQRKSSHSAAPVTSKNEPGLAEAVGKRGKVGGTKRSWGAPPGETVERTAARSNSASTDDDAVGNTVAHRPGRRNVDSNAEKEFSPDGGQSTAVSAENNDHDLFARGRPGDRYYLPPPQRNSRPRTSPDDSGSDSSSTPRASERRRKDLERWPRELREREGQQGQRRKTSCGMRRRSGGGDDNVESSSSLQPRRREARTSSSSDRLYHQQPADHRPMLGASEASGASNMPDWRYGWRGSFTTTSLTQPSQEEDCLPYYVDRKQVRV